MCLPKRWRKPPMPPPPRRPRPRHLDQRPISSSMSTEAALTSNEFSKESVVSSSSTSSIAGLKEMLPDGPFVYMLGEITRSTGNFSESQRIGGSVWKGILKDTTVAIVRRQGGVSGFRKILKSVGLVHHINLVRLLGGCKDREYVYLVYEFMNGANLRECLRSKAAPGFSVLSSWKSRMQIALDVAKGLEYLHQHVEPSFVHKYVQSTKILVGNDLRAKISHFGVAELSGEIPALLDTAVREGKAERGEIEEVRERSSRDEGVGEPRRVMRSNSIKIRGAQGYMPPEYLSSGVINAKYDIFGYGVVLLELLSGKEAIAIHSDPSRHAVSMVSITDTVQSVMAEPDSKGKLREWMDPLLKDSYPVDDAHKVAALAKSCVDRDPQKRPSMSDVAAKISKYLTSSEKWEATVGAARNILTVSMQPR